ncbi:MAG: hypothetical protein KDE26_10115 [Bacteroidetes bacterium]|nr:hypothetical protein [Bacteroidota bacterium]
MDSSSHEQKIQLILNQIIQLATGNLDARGAPDNSDDDLDGIILGLNMLGEELQKSRESLRQKSLELERQVDETQLANEMLRSEVQERRKAESQIRKLNQELEKRVEKRTAQLQKANEELEAFSYSVAHDLRSPLRSILSYSQITLKRHSKFLNEEAKRYLRTIEEKTHEMGQLIDDLLAFALLNQKEISTQTVATDKIVDNIVQSYKMDVRSKEIAWNIQSLPNIQGDRTLIKQVFTNLISNAVKFTVVKPNPMVTVGTISEGGLNTFFVKDNGVGFDMQYKDKLFGVFQRLHEKEQFEGTGVGLAIVQRIIERHHGKVWAESMIDQGATFYFSIPPELNN